MLTKGDRVMVFANADFAGGRICHVRYVNDDLVGITGGIVFRKDVAQLPLPKEPCPMCGSRDEHHSTTTCEEDRHAE